MTPSERYQKIISNVRLMADKGASNDDLLGYLQYEGLSGEQFASLLEGPTVFGQAKEALKGLIPGAVGLVETAGVGAASLLPESMEESVRGTIQETAAKLREPFKAAPGYEETIPRKLSEAVGSTIPFLAAGPFGLAGRAAAVGLGTAAGAGEARLRAEEEGATEEQRASATGFGVIPGAFEAFAPLRILGRLGNDVVASGVDQVKRALIAGGEEAAQETASGFAQNLIAQGIYKPEQELIEGLGEQAAYGGATGAIVQGLLDLAIGRRARPAGAEAEEPAAPVGVPPEARQQDLFAAEEAPLAVTQPPEEGAPIQDITAAQAESMRLEERTEEGLQAEARVRADELRDQFDRVEREVERLNAAYPTATPEEQAAITEQANQLIPVREAIKTELQKVERRLVTEERGRVAAPPEQMGLFDEAAPVAPPPTPEAQVTPITPPPTPEPPAAVEDRPEFALEPSPLETPVPEEVAPEVETRPVVEDDFKAMGIGVTNKKLREKILGKDIADPEQRDEVREALEDYANAPNRSEKLRNSVEQFLAQPMFMQQMELGLETRREPDGTEPSGVDGGRGKPSVPPSGTRGAAPAGTGAPDGEGVVQLGGVSGVPAEGTGVQQRTMRPAFVQAARRTYNKLRDEGAPSWRELGFDRQMEFMDAFEQTKGIPRYRLATEGTQGMSVDKVQKLVDRLTSKWKNAPDIFVVQSTADLEDYGLTDIGPSAKGVFYGGDQSVFLIADNITDYTDAVITVAHESIGHFGLQSVLGDKYNSTMDRLYETNAEVRKLADAAMEADPKLVDRRIAVEEVLAEAVEKKIAPQSALGRALATLRNVIRNFLNLVGAKASNSEIDALINQAANYVIAGTVQVDKKVTNTDAFKDWFGDSVIRNPDGSPKIMYHGTAADITEFRPKQANAIFVTDDPTFADTFTQMSENFLLNLADIKEVPYTGGRNIMPLYVRAERPFDYENRAHVDALMSRFNGVDRAAIEKGMWSAIEGPRAQQAIKDLGFDSFYVSKGGKKNLAVYDPNQLKSATGNEGTFRRDTGDIRYRKKKPVLTAEGERAQALNERMKGISNAKDAPADETLLKRLTGTFPLKSSLPIETRIRRQLVDKEAPVIDQVRTKFNNAVKDALDGTVRPDLLLAQKQDISNFGDKVVEIGGIEIDKNGFVQLFERKDSQGRPINMDEVLRIITVDLGKKLGSAEEAIQLAHNALIGFRANELKKVNARFEKDAQAAEAKGNKRAAERLRDQIINLKVSQEQIDASMDAMQQFPEIRNAYDVFTEFKNGLVDFLEKAGRINPETAKNWKENVGYVPWTRVEEEVNEFDTQLKPKQDAYINLSKVAHLDKEGSNKEINNIFDNMVGTAFLLTKMGVENHANLSTLKVLPDVEVLDTPAKLAEAQKKHADRLMFAFDKGERTGYLLSDPFQLEAFMTLAPLKNGIVGSLFAGTARFVRSTITHLPAFALSQLVQDGTYRAMLLSGVQNPWSLPPKVFGNFFKLVFQGSSAGADELARLGITGIYDGMPDNSVRKAKERMGIEHRNAFKRAWDGLEKFSLNADLAVRAAIYEQTMKETGGDRALAYYRAKEYINFKRQGMSPTVNTLRQSIPFMNAYLQGMDVLYRTMVGKGVSTAEKRAAQKLFFMTGMQLAALNVLYTALVTGDDEYEGLDEFVRNRNYIIPGTGVKIPVAPEVGLFFKVIPEQLYRAVFTEGTQTPQDAEAVMTRIRDAATAALGGVGVMPAAIMPALEVMTNYSFFFERPIVGAGMRNLDPNLQFTESTSELAKLLGDIGNMSPMKIDYFIKAYTGMAGALVLDTTDALANPDRLSKPIYRLPQISTFMYDPTGRGLKSNFYDFREDVAEVRDTINMLSREGRFEELEKYVTPERLEKYAFKGIVGKIEKQLSELRKYRKIISSDTQMAPEERRRLVDEIAEFERQILRAYDIPNLRKMAGY